MKRDMALIRAMVLKMEASETGFPGELEFDGYTEDQIGYHAYLMVDSGLAEGSDMTSTGCIGPYWMLTHLTSAGHDFADASRNETVWDSAMNDIKAKGIKSVSIDLLKRLLDTKLKKLMGDI